MAMCSLTTMLGFGSLATARYQALSAMKKSDPENDEENKKEVPMGALSFAADIRPLFRDKDTNAMKAFGIGLSSYEDVKKRAQHIYARLSAKEMPCDGPWGENNVQKLKEWMESGMEP